VLLKVVTEDAKTWTDWTRKYRAEGNGIPKVYVVRADGKQIYAKSGAPQALPQFLALALKSSGRIPNRVELTQLSGDLKAAQAAIKAGEIQKASKILSRRTEGIYAEPALALQKLEATLNEQGKTALAAAQTKIKDKETAFDGLLELVAVERDYSRLQPLRKPIAAAVTAVRKDAALRELLATAEVVDRAKEYESQKKLQQALKAWRLVQTKSPKSPAAKLAGERIAALEKQGVSPSAEPTPKSKRPVSGIDEKRAAFQLDLGKRYLKRSRRKAKEYFKKAIELAPKSKAADEARKLLRGL
jgi:tetratricopeptide (TPR) repeat protein